MISEYVDVRYKNAVATYLLVFDVLSGIIASAYFEYISKNWIYLQIFGVIISGISAAVSLFILESPEYLYSYGRFS